MVRACVHVCVHALAHVCAHELRTVERGKQGRSTDTGLLLQTSRVMERQMITAMAVWKGALCSTSLTGEPVVFATSRAGMGSEHGLSKARARVGGKDWTRGAGAQRMLNGASESTQWGCSLSGVAESAQWGLKAQTQGWDRRWG